MGSEVLIIGGGIIGLSIARELRNNGVREIVVVDRGKAGREASWAAAGMLAPDIEIDASTEFHRLGLESLALYPALADELSNETGIDIELDRTGTLCIEFDEGAAADLDRVFKQQRGREVAVEKLSRTAIAELEPGIGANAASGLLYPDDWQVDNRLLLKALRSSLELKGVQIIENTEVDSLLAEDEKITGAITAAGHIYADATVLATGAWTSLIKIGVVSLPFEVTPVRGQMISFAASERLLRHVVYSSRGYVVPRADNRILAGATVENVGFDKRVTDAGIEALSAAALEILPGLAKIPVAESWGGLRPFARDGLPVIGPVPGFQRAYVATAHYRNGILLAPITARIIAKMIVHGEDQDPFRSFDARRLASKAAGVTAPGP